MCEGGKLGLAPGGPFGAMRSASFMRCCAPGKRSRMARTCPGTCPPPGPRQRGTSPRDVEQLLADLVTATRSDTVDLVDLDRAGG
jgi:hypothetical protein